MKKNKKIIFNTVFLLLVFVLTIYGVFHGEDLGDVIEVIENADKRWLLPGICTGSLFYLGRISHYLVYDAFLWYSSEENILFPFFIGGLFFQLHHTVCERWAANADLLHEERKGFHSGGNGHIDDCYDHI